MNPLGWLFHAAAVGAFNRPDPPPDRLADLEAAVVTLPLALLALLLWWRPAP